MTVELNQPAKNVAAITRKQDARKRVESLEIMIASLAEWLGWARAQGMAWEGRRAENDAKWYDMVFECNGLKHKFNLED